MATTKHLALGCLAACSSSAWASSGFDWLSQNVFNRIAVSGTRTLGLNLDTVSGDTDAYDNLTMFGQGGRRFSDIGQMSLSGEKVLGLFNFNFSFADDRYQDPSARRFSLDYNRKGLKFDAGDIYANLGTGNQFVGLSRQLWGVTGGVIRGPLAVHVVATQAKSAVTTVSFAGNNSPGPYYLQASQLVADSVRVQVDGRDLQYPNDFTVNSVIGSITFNSLSVPPTSTVVVSYESTGTNSGGGSISGLGATYNFGRFGSVGFAALRQTDPAGGSLSQVTDRFQGYGDPSIPYILEYAPLASRPTVVSVDGIIQTLGADYTFSPTNPTVFYFLRYIPNTSTVTVTYTPSPSSSLRGNRDVEGVNYQFPFGKNGRQGSIAFSQAWSHLANAAQPLSGVARGVNAVYKTGNLRLNGSVDDIPVSFVGIESTGFLRNEKATNLGADYRAGRYDFNLASSNSAVDVQSANSTGALDFTSGRSTRLDAGVKYAAPGGLTWSVDQSRLGSESISGDSHADVSTLGLTKAFGRLNTRFDFNHTQGFGPISNGLTSSLGSIRLDSLSWNASYAAARGWTIGSRTSLSAVDTAGTRGLGNDLDLNLSYQAPSGRFLFNTGYTYSNSGEAATLGSFEDGTGLGYGGNGFTGGVAGSGAAGDSFNTAGTDLRRWQSTVNWELSARTSLGLTGQLGSEFGGISTNSSTTAYGLSFDYDLRDGQRFAVAIDQSDTTFGLASENADSLALDFSVGGRPRGPWSYRILAGGLLSSGGTVAQNSTHYGLSLRNRFRRNMSVGFDLSYGNLTNYDPQTEFEAAVSFEYQLFKNIALVTRYQVHNVANLDPTLTTGAYRSRGLDFQLNFNFGT